jgi:hypothetical protein
LPDLPKEKPTSIFKRQPFPLLFTTINADYPQLSPISGDEKPQKPFPMLVPGLSFQYGMIWKDDYINSLRDLPKEVQEEIMEMPDMNYPFRFANRKGLISRILQPVKHLIEKLNLLFKKNQGAKA